MEQNSSIFEEKNLLTEEAKMHLAGMAKWTKFLSIVGIIVTVMMLLGVTAISTTFSAMSSMPDMGPFAAMGVVGFTIIYLIMLLLYVYPIYCLYRFSTNIKKALTENDSYALAEAFKHQKNLFMFMGVLTIIMISFYVLAFFLGVLMNI